MTKPKNRQTVKSAFTPDARQLSDAELAEASGAILSNLANMRHEMLKAVANNLRA